MSIFTRPQFNKNDAIQKEVTTQEKQQESILLTLQPYHSINLFNVCGSRFIEDKSLIKRSALVFEQLSDDFKLIFNAIFWDQDRFRLFCTVPSSLNGHHSFENGNLRHTVEVFEQMILLLNSYPFANKEIALALAIFHDIGKCVEYELSNNNRWKMSNRGKLVGHKITCIEWISAAIAVHKIQLKPNYYECLIHGLSSVINSPDWVGLRQTSTIEATLLSMADRLSATASMYEMTSSVKGFGEKHPHLKAAFFTIGGD